MRAKGDERLFRLCAKHSMWDKGFKGMLDGPRVCAVVGMLYTMCFMCSCHTDDQADFPPSVIREYTCILRKCTCACVGHGDRMF
jgi:hypothetical protein